MFRLIQSMGQYGIQFENDSYARHNTTRDRFIQPLYEELASRKDNWQQLIQENAVSGPQLETAVNTVATLGRFMAQMKPYEAGAIREEVCAVATNAGYKGAYGTCAPSRP